MSPLLLYLENVKVNLDDILILKFESFEDHIPTLQEVFTQGKERQPTNQHGQEQVCCHWGRISGFQYLWSRSQTSREKLKQSRILQPIPISIKCTASLEQSITTNKWSLVTLMLPLATDHTARCQIQMDPQLSSSFWYSEAGALKRSDVDLCFTKPFEIYTNASKLQLGIVISQDKQPSAFYSWKLSDAQKGTQLLSWNCCQLW